MERGLTRGLGLSHIGAKGKEIGKASHAFYAIVGIHMLPFSDLLGGVSYFELDAVRVEEKCRVVALAVLWTVDWRIFDIHML